MIDFAAYLIILSLAAFTTRAWGVREEGWEAFAVVYHFDNQQCRNDGQKTRLPHYLVQSIEQTLRVHHSDVHVVLMTNAADCRVHTLEPSTSDGSSLLSKVMIVDFKSLSAATQRAVEAESIFKKSLFSHVYETVNTDSGNSNGGNKKGGRGGENVGQDGHLYLSSLVRFVHLEALLVGSQAGVGALRCVNGHVLPPLRELLLVESDNLMYTDLNLLLPSLRSFYGRLAGVVQSHANFVASVLYVANTRAMTKFNDFLLDLGHNHTSFQTYIEWYGSMNRRRIPGGLPPLDEQGRGIPPYSVNEMTIMRYYHATCRYNEEEEEAGEGGGGDGKTNNTTTTGATSYGNDNSTHTAAAASRKGRCLESLPLWGRHQGLLKNSRHVDMRGHVGVNTKIDAALPQAVRDMPRQVGAATMDAGWDPGSWGQYLGGTYMLKRPQGFIDLVHVAGKGIVRGACKPVMLCSCVSRTPPRDYSGEGIRVEGDLLPESAFEHDAFSRQAPDTESQRLYFVLRDHQTSKPAKAIVPVTYTPSKLGGNGNSDGSGDKDDGSKQQQQSYSAPYLRCCANAGGKTEADVDVTWGADGACGPWQPLANLHVHSKNTLPFMSRACTCDE